ncbi:TDP-N-acetylfucosamine:lipid II N-acetylfucosaminyltransferase [Brachymonas denitrificans]|uniref:TDP-N-acetylfucosamine:lipid II N-acetylfucosaminyltransferase n=1 Tax=Brachymonas denitrificans TaxID=28220 RepID=UPI00322013B9
MPRSSYSYNKAADILHIVLYEKFIPAFIALVNQKLDASRHHFFFIHNGHRYSLQGGEVVTRDSDVNGLFSLERRLLVEMNRAKKVVIHGLFDSRLIALLFFQPWLLPKCYWVIWGGDLYTYKINQGGWKWRVKEWFRRPVIRRLGHLLTYVDGDVRLARQWYKARGEYHECLVYPSNTFHATQLPPDHHNGLQILIGNSADPSNEHIEVLNKLRSFNGTQVRAFVPLSYGDATYAEKVIEVGRDVLGDDFVPLREFMCYDNYLRLLAGIDIAIFNHRRQQGMGNIISLLGLGKTVYIRSDTTSWQTLTSMGLILGDTLNLALRTLPKEIGESNKVIIAQRFSESVLVSQLHSILES